MADIRLFRPQDIDALYAISVATGHLGGDASRQFADPRVIGDIFSAPYALLEPSLALVVEDQGRLVGFAVGTLDTARWEARLERDWWPRLRHRYADSAHVPAAERNADQMRAFFIHHPTATPHSVRQGYPAHLHLNLLPELQGKGWGRRLFTAWCTTAKRQGAGALHVLVARANGRAIGFWARQGFAALAFDDTKDERRLWMGRPDQ
ncbi:MAG: GNAT family N-acetyltransferase [Pseudomonadota bacterium]